MIRRHRNNAHTRNDARTHRLIDPCPARALAVQLMGRIVLMIVTMTMMIMIMIVITTTKN